MKKRLAKKLVRRGRCPQCAYKADMVQWSPGFVKVVSTICHKCCSVAVINGNGVEISIDEDIREFINGTP